MRRALSLLTLLAVLVLSACAAHEIPRVEAAEAHARVSSGKALLVCAYDDDSKCHEVELAGAMPLATFQQKADALPREQPLIFYCS